MVQTTASDQCVEIHEEEPAASSHNAVKSSVENESGGTGAAAAPHGFCSGRCSFIFYAVDFLITLLFMLILAPFWLLSKLLIFPHESSPVKALKNRNTNCNDPNSDGRFRWITIPSGGATKWLRAAKWRHRINLLLALSVVIVEYVPGLKRIKVLGWPLNFLMVMLTGLITSYSFITIPIEVIPDKWKEKDVVYYLDGLRRRGYIFIACVVILLAWELHFRSPRHGHRLYGVSEKALKFGTSTIISLLVGALLDLVRKALILSWESRAIYRQFTRNIRQAGLQLYFLGLVHGIDVDIFSPNKRIPGMVYNMKNSDNDGDNSATEKKLSIYRKKQMAQYFISMARLSPREDDTIPNNIRKQWEKFKERNSDIITKDSVKKNLEVQYIFMSEVDIDGLFKQLGDADKLKNNSNPSSTDTIPYGTFEEWMMKAFKNCLSFGYTLIDAQRATNNLSNIMRAFMVIVVIFCFLFLTGNASTKVLVTIGSLFASAAFIFGDMLKAAFEGIIFAFVMHPFVVGDLCIIDGIELEVRSIDILKTTFRNIENKVEVLYPNKVLAWRTFSNYKRHLEGKDYVELSLKQPVDIDFLKDEIKSFFNKHPQRFKGGNVMIKEIGETIKIAIYFKHVMSIQDGTHVQCLKKKKRQRSELLEIVLKSAKFTAESSRQRTCETAKHLGPGGHLLITGKESLI